VQGGLRRVAVSVAFATRSVRAETQRRNRGAQQAKNGGYALI
jgi:hypothetical protein